MITQGNGMLCKWCRAVVKWEGTLYAWRYAWLCLPISWQHWLHPLRLPIRIRLQTVAAGLRHLDHVWGALFQTYGGLDLSNFDHH